MSPVEFLRTKILEYIPTGDVPSSFSVTPQEILEFGDYSTNIAFICASALRQSPEQVAINLIQRLESDTQVRENVERIEFRKPGFINFFISRGALIGAVNSAIQEGKTYGALPIGAGKKVIVEYFQNNIAKPPHVGHLRSGFIGDAIARILEYTGYHVITDTHIGDWGTQFGILLYAYKQWGDDAVIRKDPVTELNRLYVQANSYLAEHPETREECKQEFKKLEDGDPENRRLWEWFSGESMRVFHAWRLRLRLRPFEYDFGESFYEPYMQQDIETLRQKNLLIQGETGEWYVDLETQKLGRCIIIKSDGATTYHTRDISTYTYQKERFGFDLRLYVVDNRQSHHFAQLFEVLARMGYSAHTDARHIHYGYLRLPEGAMSTRKGTVILLEDVIDMAVAQALAIINEKNPELPNKEATAESIALGALKFFDLLHEPGGDIIFTKEKILSFEGLTGPYIQYTYARLAAILRKAGDGEWKVSPEWNPGPDERALLREIVFFPEILVRAAGELKPHYVAQYIGAFAQKVNSFYHAVPVLKEENSVIRESRIACICAFRTVLGNGMRLLGIPVIEEI